MRKKCSSDQEKLQPQICKIFEITRTIYSNSERLEQFLVTECLFNLFLAVGKKLLGFRNMQEKLERLKLEDRGQNF